jgi:hypothetical protein
MPNDMAQQLQRFADRNAMKLGPFIRHICQDYLNDLTGGDLDTTGRGRRAA